MQTQTETRHEFEQYAETGNAFIEKLGITLDTERNPQKNLRILKRVFSALRCHLPLHESVKTIEILPMAIRGLYVDGWELRNTSPRLTTVDHFAAELMGGDGGKRKVFKHYDEAIHATLAVIEAIAHFVPREITGNNTDRLPRGLSNLYNTLTRTSSRNAYAYHR